MFTRHNICVIVAMTLFASTLATAEEVKLGQWPQWRGPERNGWSPDRNLLKDWEANPPKLAWMAEGLGEGYAGVSVADGRIYSTGNLSDGQAVIAINAADGNVLWTQSLTSVVPRHGYQGSRCTPTVDGDRLYVVASSGAIVCLKAADGEIIWTKDFQKEWSGKMMSGWGYSESPLVDGDWVLCTPGGRDAMIVALNKLTGDEIWRSEVPRPGADAGKNGKSLKDGAGYSSIVISEAAGVKQYVQLIGQGVIGVRASDGKFLWSYSGVANGTANIPTPVVSGDFIFCSTGYNTGSALLKLSSNGDGVQAEEVYFLNQGTLQNKHGGMVLVNGHIYCGHGNGSGIPICIEMATGKVAWGGDKRGPGSGEAAVIYADGNIIYRFQDGIVALIEATPLGYNVKGSFKPVYQEGKSWAHPVVVGGRLYLREQNKLMCYDIGQSL
jgi:outer membrane protein assembly factor BamB